MGKLGIIADDLTGANDAGVQFSKQGLRTVVVWDLSFVTRVVVDADVMVIDTESRTASKEEAYSKVKEATRALVEAGFDLLFKKMDSTLRGNIGAELDGVCDAFGKLIFLVAPAFPGNRRTTLGGQQLLDGVPLEHAGVARDSLSPVKQSHVVDLIQTQSRRRAGHIPLAVVASGADLLRSTILVKVQQGYEILVLDAVTNDHLSTIAKAASELGSTVLLVGSAGLAEEVPFAFNLLPEKRHVLVVAGSMSEVTARQVLFLTKKLKIEPVILDFALLRGKDSRIKEISKAIKSVKQELNASSVAILALATLFEKRENEEASLFFDEVSRHLVLKALGEVVAGSIDGEISGLVLTGGDTAMAVINAIGAEGIGLEDEIESGIAVGVVRGGAWDGLRVATKAGAFGNELSLLRAVERLQKR